MEIHTFTVFNEYISYTNGSLCYKCIFCLLPSAVAKFLSQKRLSHPCRCHATVPECRQIECQCLICLWCRWHYSESWYPLVLNMAMENAALLDDFPIWMANYRCSIYGGFLTAMSAMFDYRRFIPWLRLTRSISGASALCSARVLVRQIELPSQSRLIVLILATRRKFVLLCTAAQFSVAPTNMSNTAKNKQDACFREIALA